MSIFILLYMLEFYSRKHFSCILNVKKLLLFGQFNCQVFNTFHITHTIVRLDNTRLKQLPIKALRDQKPSINDQVLNLEKASLKKNKIMNGLLVVEGRCKSETFESFIQLGKRQLLVFFNHHFKNASEAFLLILVRLCSSLTFSRHFLEKKTVQTQSIINFIYFHTLSSKTR